MAKRVCIKKLFHGLASVRDYLVYEAKRNGEDLLIVLESTGERMLVPNKEIWERSKRTTKEKFKSKHNNREYYLLDFDWQPTSVQQNLFDDVGVTETTPHSL